MNVVVKKYVVRDREFTIVKHEDMYCAIENKYIDKDGRLTEKLNGLQMNASEDLRQCLRLTKDAVDTDYYRAQGLSDAEIYSKITGTPLEKCELLFA